MLADGAASLTGADHDVDGAAIAAADHETLRDLGFTTVGHRLSLLRAVFDIKCREGLPIDDDWLPPCASATDTWPTDRVDERFAPHYRSSASETEDDGPVTPRRRASTRVCRH